MTHSSIPQNSGESAASSLFVVRKYAYLSIGAALLTIVMKFGAYWMTGSVGLFSDAVESLVNLAAAVVAVIAITIAHKPADDDHSYGHGKAEYFSSGAEGVLVLVAAAGIAIAGVDRFFNPRPLDAMGIGLIVSLAAAGVNWATARTMLRAAKRFDSITLEADAEHLQTDVWTSCGVVSGLTIAWILPDDFSFIDPLIAVGMSVHIAFTGLDLIKRSAQGLMDKALPEEEQERLQVVIANVLPEGTIVHDLRTRKAGSHRFVEFHLLVDGETTVQKSHDMCCLIEEAILGELAQTRVNIHVEPLDDVRSFAHEKTGEALVAE